MCGYGSLACGVLFLLLGAWAVHLYWRFTPVYRDITCKMDSPKLSADSTADAVGAVIGGLAGLIGGAVRTGGSVVQLQLSTTTTCENPNGYSVELQSTAPGQVYIGQYSQPPIAQIMQIPASTLPAQGSGSVTARVSFPLDLSQFGSLADSVLPGLLSGSIPVYVESHMEVVIGMKFLVGGLSLQQPFDKKCVFSMAPGGSIGAPLRAGPMTCADDFASLRPQPVDGDASNEIRFSAGSMAADDVARGTKAKNIGLGALIGISFALAVLLLCTSPCCVLRGCRLLCPCCCRARARKSADDEVNSAVPAAPIGAQHPELEV